MLFDVDRRDFRQTRWEEQDRAALADGQIRLAVERFALTANNITYAVAGDLLDYWGFFPAAPPWGRVPVIGLGSVVESANPEIEVGGRYFGFYPMATEIVIDAQRRGASGFRDVGVHRAEHAPTYTDFRDVSGDPMFQAADQYLLLYGMFMTSFLVDDHLDGRSFEGVRTVIVTSASSKTSISLGSRLADRPDIVSIGMTSNRNRSFVESLELYDRVVTYEQVDQVDASVPTGVVDMAGSNALLSSIHHHIGEQLRFSLSVGGTHWEDRKADAEPLPGAAPEFFFAPTQVAKRVNDWGADELQDRIRKAYIGLVEHSESWLQIELRIGTQQVEDAYRALLEGTADPAVGVICSINPDPSQQ